MNGSASERLAMQVDQFQGPTIRSAPLKPVSFANLCGFLLDILHFATCVGRIGFSSSFSTVVYSILYLSFADKVHLEYYLYQYIFKYTADRSI